MIELASGLLVPDQAAPSTPPSARAALYSGRWAGHSEPVWLADAGVPREIGREFAARRAHLVIPNGTTGVVNVGGAMTVTGGSTATSTHTSFFASQRRLRLTSAATAGQLSTSRATQTQYAIGSSTSPAYGGFFHICRFGIQTVQTGHIFFAGLSGAAHGVTAIPSTATNYIGMWITSGLGNSGANFVIAARGASGTEQVIDLGANYPVGAATDIYELRLWCPAGGTSVGYSVARLSAPSQAPAQGTLSTNLPAASTGLAMNIQHSNNATAAAVSTDMIVQYVEAEL